MKQFDRGITRLGRESSAANEGCEKGPSVRLRLIGSPQAQSHDDLVIAQPGLRG